MSNKIRRWYRGAAPAVGIHICIGSVYAWSVFTEPVMNALGATLEEVQWAFSIAIFFLGMSAAFLGNLVDKLGPRKSGMICGICFGVGIVGSGFAVSLGSLPLLYLFYGVIGGIGLGVGYITPVKTLVNWFYDRRGLATGLAIMGFGFASAIAGPLILIFIEAVGLVSTFFVMGIVYFCVIMLSAFMIRPAPEEFIAAAQVDKKSEKAIKQYSSKEAIRTWKFYALWVMLFINITCGLAIISVASPLMQEVTGTTAVIAAATVGFMGIANGLGRFFWATISDYVGRPIVYIIFFALQIVVMLVLYSSTSILLYQILFCLVMTCYGGGFSCIPAYLSDVFGTKQLSSIHGRVLTAWACAGIAGPVLTVWAKSITGNYQTALLIFVGLFAVAAITSVVTLLKLKKEAQA